ncbi:hypothetical protein F383_28347 [Gossypium arboreum]|uniref:Uncharacterized protein n=1 Tax=Gossypium arboreum TaxID=29729 RepID=A0A0B0P6T9_GOSAR|nr:hypothetical protein F383_28347 [Gossypium arboreum]
MDQSMNSTRPGPPHTGRPHGRVNLADSKHEAHGHSKAYKYTLEEESREAQREEGRNYSKEAD